MHWQRLLQAPPMVVVHAFMAMAAFWVGLAQFALPKGTMRHRVMGWGWVALMASVALGSFAIQTLRPGHFSFVHLVSAWTLVFLVVAVVHARRHRVTSHAWAMVGLFAGALLIAGAFTLMPGRIMHDVVFGSLTPAAACG